VAFGSREIKVTILGDSRDLERAFDRSSKAARDFNRDVTSGSGRAQLAFSGLGKEAAKMAGGFLAVDAAARALGTGLKVSVEAASNLTEQIGKSRIVFGGASRDVEAWAKTTSTSFGIANDQALETAGTFGNLFRTVGLVGKANADMSTSLVELAADLAAFNNIDDVSQVLDALRSGLVGEAEPLRRLGVRLSEARVQQDALRESGKRSVKQLTEQEKMLARYRIILTDSKTAQGNFAATQDSLAQQSKVLKAQLRDLSTVIGGMLIPAITGIVTTANTAIQDVRELGDALAFLASKLPLPPVFPDGAGETAKKVLGDLLPAIPVVEQLATGIHGAADAYRDFRAAAATPVVVTIDFQTMGPVGLLTGAGLGLAAKDRIESRGLGTPPAPLTTKQRRDFFDANVARQRDAVQDIANNTAKITRLEGIRAKLQGKLATTKDPTRRLSLEREILEVNRDIRAVRGEMHAESASAASDAKASAEELKRLAEERADAARERAQTAQFAALGLGPNGEALAPGLGALRKRLGRTQKALAGTILDPKRKSEMVRLLETMKRILAGKLGEVGEEMRRKLEELLAGLDKTIAEHAKRRRTRRFRPVDVDDLLAGLGLSRDEIRALKQRLAVVGAGGTAPLGGQGAFGYRLPGAIVINGGVTVKADNPDVIARELQKRARRTATQTRGVRAGSRQGIDG